MSSENFLNLILLAASLAVGLGLVLLTGRWMKVRKSWSTHEDELVRDFRKRLDQLQGQGPFSKKKPRSER